MASKTATSFWSQHLGRVIQIIISLSVLVGLIVQGGRILERMENSKKEILDLINYNETKRDLRETINKQEIEQLRGTINREIEERKDHDNKNDPKLEKLRDLYLVKFGQPSLGDK